MKFCILSAALVLSRKLEEVNRNWDDPEQPKEGNRIKLKVYPLPLCRSMWTKSKKEVCYMRRRSAENNIDERWLDIDSFFTYY